MSRHVYRQLITIGFYKSAPLNRINKIKVVVEASLY